jgi:hypothetical protein
MQDLTDLTLPISSGGLTVSCGQDTVNHNRILTLPISSVGLRMGDDVGRVAVGLRLKAPLCELHTCPCGTRVDASGAHGLSCKRGAGCHIRHGLLNDVIWQAMQHASTKEELSLFRSDGIQPDGVSK